MPNRMIKESIRSSKSINALTDFQFRVWLYLITYVDDYGRGSADAELLKGFVFPRRKRVTESDIEKALADLAGMGCIDLYNVDGESYFCFPNWGEHQRIQQKRSKFPDPASKCTNPRCSTVGHGGSPPETKPNRNQTETETETETESIVRQADAAANPRKRFIAPSVEDVSAYCAERVNGIDPQHFVDYNAARGWMVGKVPMRDWKAAVRTWERNEKGGAGGAGRSTSCGAHQSRPNHGGNASGYDLHDIARV